MTVEIDAFSGFRVYPSKGKLFVRGDSKVFRFAQFQESSLFSSARTHVYRRMHKKGITEEVAKKRSRRTVKHQRGIVVLTLLLSPPGATRPLLSATSREFRPLQRPRLRRKRKSRKKAKPARAPVASGPRVSKQQMKGGKGGR
ncbi:hypothetical protein BDR07DRAFT_1433685 [Suillus spraguei]|nr:hypothetical protein BDR07DRAFT_1433685 [Suillus spraguei]